MWIQGPRSCRIWGMGYPAAAIANELLELARLDGKKLTPMQVQKLVYFAHGWNLALTGEPLIDERIEAWEYGPVVKSLYKDFREFGSGFITKLAKAPDLDGAEYSWTTPCIDDGPDDELNEFTKALVQKIWEVYGGYSAFRLSEMTHAETSPWTAARRNPHQFIPDDSIRDYFKQMNLDKTEDQIEAGI